MVLVWPGLGSFARLLEPKPGEVPELSLFGSLLAAWITVFGAAAHFSHAPLGSGMPSTKMLLHKAGPCDFLGLSDIYMSIYGRHVLGEDVS